MEDATKKDFEEMFGIPTDREQVYQDGFEEGFKIGLFKGLSQFENVNYIFTKTEIEDLRNLLSAYAGRLFLEGDMIRCDKIKRLYDKLQQAIEQIEQREKVKENLHE